MIGVKFEDNSVKFKKDWENKRKKILWAWGLKWQELATKIITINRIVVSGRLRGSLTFITPDKVGTPISRVPENKPSDFLKGKAPENSIIVGSNVEYAAKNELENPKGSFVRPAILTYRDSYQNIAKQIMKE